MINRQNKEHESGQGNLFLESTEGDLLTSNLKGILPSPTTGYRTRLSRIHIENWRSFKSLDFQLTDFNIIVGTNNSGKSSILQAINLAFQLFRVTGAFERGFLKGVARVVPDFVFPPVSDILSLWYNKRTSTGKEYIPIVFEVELTNGDIYEFQIRRLYGQPNMRMTKYPTSKKQGDVESILRSAPVLVPSFSGVIAKEEYRSLVRRGTLASEGRFNEILRNIILDVKNREPKRLETLSNLLATHFGVSFTDVHHDPDSEEFITTNYKESDIELDIISSGSGSLQIIQILSYIFLTSPGVVLLDEPDAHLHPSLQRKLIDFIIDLSTTNKIQTIIATHSKEIINYVDPALICAVAKGETKVTRFTDYPNVVSLLSSLGSIDNIDLALLLRYRKCVFVEGKGDKMLKRFASILGSKVFEGENQVIIFCLDGKGNIDRYGDFVKVLESFLNTGVRNLFIRDRDFMNDEILEEFNDEYVLKKLNVHILDRKEIENYLVVPALLQRVVKTEYEKRHNKQLDFSAEEVTEMLDKACESARQDLLFSVQDKILKFLRRRDEKIDTSTAGKRAAQYIESMWTDLDSKLRVCPGEVILSSFTAQCQQKFQVSFSISTLLFMMKPSEISVEIKELVGKLEKL